MTRLFLSFLVATILSLTALSAAGMNKEKCDKPNCKIEMKKENCKCGMKKADCKMPNCKMGMKKEGSCGAGKCGKDMMKANKGEMSGNAGKKMSGSCGAGKCGAGMMKSSKAEPVKKEAKMCGCGMTQDSCKKMMISCKHRDAREAKEAQNK